MGQNLVWTGWAEVVSEDGRIVVRARLGIRVTTADWGRKGVSIQMERIAYRRQDGARQPIKPLIR
ncbi:hypothetical protein AB0469_40925, partial [Streptomyces sp. NPDC093801]|uniref:hypothetical protein n=1 Tax=Streptomyces sp. NPDC093801 TaxID=3155203 RepID=UPI00344E0E6B